MKHIILIRDEASDQGTFGRLHVVETGYSCYTAELPWRDNQRSISSIPEGAYGASYLARSTSGKFRNVYHVHGVQDRSAILIHAGNRAGDKKMGFVSDSYGCILIGKRRGVLDGQQAVLASRTALKELVAELGQESVKLLVWDRSSEKHA